MNADDFWEKVEDELWLQCDCCDGTGVTPGGHPCPDCHGSNPRNANPACDTCLGFGGYGSCADCAGTGSTMATPEERAAQRNLDLLLQQRAH